MHTKKLWDYTIEIKEGFLLRKRKVYPLLREERENIYELIQEQLRKRYIRFSKLLSNGTSIFIRKKNGKKHIVQDYMYLNE